MLHGLHHLPNPFPQPCTYPHEDRPPTPEPYLEYGAFASQLDEIDHLLHAFRLQRQSQSAYQWMAPADEDTDEKLLDSETDGESGRRWSSSTEGKSAEEGRGDASDAVRMDGTVSPLTHEGQHLINETPTGQARDGALRFSSEFLGSNPLLGDSPSAAEVRSLRKEQRFVGRAVCWEERPDPGKLLQLRARKGNDSYESCTTVKCSLKTSESGGALLPFSRLETTRARNELSPVRRLPLDLPLMNEWDHQATKERTRESCSVET